MSKHLDVRTSVRTLLSPTPRDAAEQRHEMRRCAARVIRAYRKAKPILEGDACACALATAQFLDIIERGLKDKR